MKKKNSICIVFCLLFVSFSALLYHSLPSFESHCEIDSTEYDLVARTYAQTGALVHPDIGRPVHPFGYYWFLGLIYSFFGYNQIFIFCIQCLLSLLCFLMLYRLTGLLFDNPLIATIAFCIACCNIGFLAYSQLILAEILLTTCLVGFLYSFALFIKKQNIRYLACASLLLCSSVLVKACSALFLYYYGIFYVACNTRNSQSANKKLLFTTTFILYAISWLHVL